MRTKNYCNIRQLIISMGKIDSLSYLNIKNIVLLSIKLIKDCLRNLEYYKLSIAEFTKELLVKNVFNLDLNFIKPLQTWV